MLKCRNCQSETTKLIADGDRYGCPYCLEPRNERNPNLHMKVNPFCKDMTYADRMRIVTRTKGKDGVWRAAPRWRDTDGF